MLIAFRPSSCSKSGSHIVFRIAWASSGSLAFSTPITSAERT